MASRTITLKSVATGLLAACLAIGGLVAAAPPASAATTRYVSVSGSDSNPGTKDAPYRTVTKGLKSLAAGDTLYVRGGRYVEQVKVYVNAGSQSAPVTVAAYPGERPVVEGLFWIKGMSWWTFDGINVTWGSANDSGDHMVKFTGSTNWSYVNAEVWGARSYAGILVAGEARNFRLANLYVHDTYPSNGTNQDHLVYVNAPGGNGVIERNVLAHSQNGRAVKIGPPSSSHPGTDGIVIRYNTMYDNQGPSNIQIAWDSGNTKIYRNIMVRSGDRRSNVTVYDLTGTNNVVSDNYGWESARVMDSGEPGLVDGGGNHHADPQLDADFRPQNPDAQAYGAYASGDAGPSTEPTAESTPEPTPEPTLEPTPEPTAEPTPEPTASPDDETSGSDDGTTTADDGSGFTPAEPTTADGIEFRAASTGANVGGDSVTVPAPSGVQAGDVLVASVDVRGKPAITAPEGWIVLCPDRVGNTMTKESYIHVATSDEPASYTWTFSRSESASAIVVAYAGVDTMYPVAAQGGQPNHVRSYDIEAPSVTADVPGVVVTFFGTATEATITPPVGMVERGEDGSHDDRYKVTSQASERRLDEPGETGVATAAASRHAQSIAQVVVLRPAA